LIQRFGLQARMILSALPYLKRSSARHLLLILAGPVRGGAQLVTTFSVAL